MSEALRIPTEAPAVPAAPQWDPFQLMDRMDEEALRRELDGVASTDLVYVVKEGGQEVVGLSKTGVDECCMALVSQGPRPPAAAGRPARGRPGRGGLLPGRGLRPRQGARRGGPP